MLACSAFECMFYIIDLNVNTHFIEHFYKIITKNMQSNIKSVNEMQSSGCARAPVCITFFGSIGNGSTTQIDNLMANERSECSGSRHTAAASSQVMTLGI